MQSPNTYLNNSRGYPSEDKHKLVKLCGRTGGITNREICTETGWTTAYTRELLNALKGYGLVYKSQYLGHKRGTIWVAKNMLIGESE